MKKKYYTWQDVERASEKIIIDMYQDQWYPDYIVGITRGGLTLATILSNKLNVRMETLKVKLRDCKPDETCESNLWMADDAFGALDLADQEIHYSRWDINRRKKILIVDDINDSGSTFNWITNDWQSSCFPNESEVWGKVWGNNVRFAVMTENLSSDFHKVNYHYEEVDKNQDDVWLVWPWEYD